MKTGKRYANVQGLRAVAALFVFGLHLNVLELRFTGSAFLDVFTPIGNWGVDLFFVISGFVMITSTWNEFATPSISGRFFLRRLTRIYPPYLVILIPITLLYLHSPNMVNAGEAIKPNILASYLLLPQRGFGLLIVGWTLVYEMFFYLVFAVVLTLDRRYCLPLMGVWALVTLIASLASRPLNNIYLNQYTDPLMLEFMMGVAIGYLFQLRRVSFVMPCIIAGVIGMVAADLYYIPIDAALGLNGYLRFLLIGVPISLIFIGVVGLETEHEWTFPGWTVIIGNASYSLYLWHAPLTVFAGRLSEHYGDVLHKPVAHAVWLAVIVAFVIGTSIGLYYLIERPLLKFFNKRLKTGLAKSDASGTLELPKAAVVR